MSRSSARAQTEPLAALVAVVAVGLGLGLYAGVLDAKLPGSPDRNLAGSSIEPVESTVAPAGVATPSRLDDARRAGPDGYETNVTLTVDDRSWAAGPIPPAGASNATTRVGTRTAPATVRAGTLEVWVWT